jgi:hypothetical protein
MSETDQRKGIPVVRGLFEVIDGELRQQPGYCITHGFPNYMNWEIVVAEPALEKAGFETLGWGDGDGDSFGPLTRRAMCVKDGQQVIFVYG